MRLFRRRRHAVPPRPPAEHETVRATRPAAPMTDLEAALAQVEADGQTLKQHLDADVDIDQLRVPDDTSPILRRALDHLAEPEDGEPG